MKRLWLLWLRWWSWFKALFAAAELTVVLPTRPPPEEWTVTPVPGTYTPRFWSVEPLDKPKKPAKRKRRKPKKKV